VGYPARDELAQIIHEVGIPKTATATQRLGMRQFHDRFIHGISHLDDQMIDRLCDGLCFKLLNDSSEVLPLLFSAAHCYGHFLVLMILLVIDLQQTIHSVDLFFHITKSPHFVL
jgi:hypothetical protein